MAEKRAHFTTPDTKLMHHRWILVAHQAGARIFEEKNGAPLTLVQRVAHPEGHLKNLEINTDKAGTAYHSTGGRQHSLNSKESAHEQISIYFAEHLSQLMKAGKEEKKFLELILVADPKFLGRVKNALDNSTLKTVTKTISKDFAKTPDEEVVKKLKSLLH